MGLTINQSLLGTVHGVIAHASAVLVLGMRADQVDSCCRHLPVQRSLELLYCTACTACWLGLQGLVVQPLLADFMCELSA